MSAEIEQQGTCILRDRLYGRIAEAAESEKKLSEMNSHQSLKVIYSSDIDKGFIIFYNLYTFARDSFVDC